MIRGEQPGTSIIGGAIIIAATAIKSIYDSRAASRSRGDHKDSLERLESSTPSWSSYEKPDDSVLMDVSVQGAARVRPDELGRSRGARGVQTTEEHQDQERSHDDGDEQSRVVTRTRCRSVRPRASAESHAADAQNICV